MGGERIYVTGIGAVSAAGNDVDGIVGALKSGKTFLRPAEEVDKIQRVNIFKTKETDNQSECHSNRRPLFQILQVQIFQSSKF